MSSIGAGMAKDRPRGQIVKQHRIGGLIDPDGTLLRLVQNPPA